MNNAVITHHAKERAKKRFGLSYNQAESFIDENLRKATYVGVIMQDNGKEARLFGYGRIAILLDIDKDVVITVYRQQPIQVEKSLRKAVDKAIAAELSKMERRVDRKAHAIERTKADLHREISERMDERLRTKSTAKKLALTAYINALQAHFTLLDGDYTEVLREQSKLRKGVVAYV